MCHMKMLITITAVALGIAGAVSSAQPGTRRKTSAVRLQRASGCTSR
jgi:hypothetical protein